jgi:regulator of protease activity HflC (stomatin/prohibitin superfamily)
VIAVVTKNGEFLGYWESGLHWCLPWTEATYLVTRQNIVFDMPVTLCPTSDNIFIDVGYSFAGIYQSRYIYI